jgi:N-acetylmuramoyl-L-alanine amidase
VLVTAFMPAVLVEIGFGTNREDAAFVSSPMRQREIAETIAAATIEYLESYERRLGTAGR